MDKTRLALGIAGAAAVLALAGNWLLWVDGWGVGASLFLALCVASALAASRLGPGPLAARWALGVAAAFAFAYAWRATPWLRSLDVLMVAVALTVPVWRAASGSLRRVLPGEAIAGAWTAATGAVTGWVNAFDPEIRWAELRKGGNLRHGVGVLLGLAIALPLLLVFGGLFMAADAQFSKLVHDVVNFRLDEAIAHVFVFGLLFWGVGAFMFTLFWRREASEPGWRFAIGLTPVATVLVLLDALFGVFVVLQLPYLFGGAARVATQAGLTYAEYARHGFFELVTVTALALPLLLGLHMALGARTPRAERAFRVLAGALVLLLAVIVASATQRMWLYQATYGWTTARLFVLAFEGWLATVLVWFSATVLRGRDDRFVFGTLVWGFIAAALLHLPNWEALIVRHNVSMATAGHPIQPGYLWELSADAVPALVETLPTFQGETARRVAQRVQEYHHAGDVPDWRRWTWAQAAATRAVDARLPLVELYAKPALGPPYVQPYSSDWSRSER
jgi:hypothetical protein